MFEWIATSYILRGVATFFVGIAMTLAQQRGELENQAYKNLASYKVTLYTEDGLRLAARHIQQGKEKVVIITHGIAHSRQRPLILELAERIASHYDVLTFDLRGHGESEGEFSGGEKEIMDIQAVVEYLQSWNYKNIGLLAFSAGGIAAAHYQAKFSIFKAMVMVSLLADPEKVERGGGGMLTTKSDVLQAMGIPFLYLMGTRIKVPLKIPAPLGVIDQAQAPILFIHGEKDWVIDAGQSSLLYEKARHPRNLILLESTEHAEDLYKHKKEEFYGAMMSWFAQYL